MLISHAGGDFSGVLMNKDLISLDYGSTDLFLFYFYLLFFISLLSCGCRVWSKLIDPYYKYIDPI